MKVILMQTVPKVGKEGTVVTVADGFARNYLFPKKLAIIADRKQVAALQIRNERAVSKLAGLKAEAETLKEKLDGKSITIEAKVGKVQGKLFGSITNIDVAEAIKNQLGTNLERKQIALVDPIRKLGTFEVVLDLHREVDAHIHVNVIDPDAPVVAVAEEEALQPA